MTGNAATDLPLVARSALTYALGAIRSNQDVLLHKVERTEVVREQLELNRTAIGAIKEALGGEPR